MSVKMISLVWEQATVGGSELLVLLALADYADDEGGSIYPSMQSIAKKARLSVDQARRVIHKLIADGAVELVEEGGWDGKRNRSNEYRIVLGNGVLANCKGGTRTKAGGGTRADASTVLAPMQDDPSYNRHLDPPLEINDDGDDRARARGEVIKAYHDNIGVIAPLVGEQLFALMDEVGQLSVMAGILAAANQNKRSYSYVRSCARNHANGVEKPVPRGGDYAPQHRGQRESAGDVFRNYARKKGVAL